VDWMFLWKKYVLVDMIFELMKKMEKIVKLILLWLKVVSCVTMFEV